MNILLKKKPVTDKWKAISQIGVAWANAAAMIMIVYFIAKACSHG